MTRVVLLLCARCYLTMQADALLLDCRAVLRLFYMYRAVLLLKLVCMQLVASCIAIRETCRFSKHQHDLLRPITHLSLCAVPTPARVALGGH
jgi:hypothetical protein